MPAPCPPGAVQHKGMAGWTIGCICGKFLIDPHAVHLVLNQRFAIHPVDGAEDLDI